MIEVILAVLGALAVSLAVACLAALPVGLIRWRLARLYWHTHEGGPQGYRRDCLLLTLPLMFLVLGMAVSAYLAPLYGLGVFIFVAPIALGLSVALVVLPPFKRASIRIMRARYPLEAPNVR
jgi:hypothetical protein